MSNGYEIQGNYTWSRALNYDQDYYAIDPKVNHGLANTNRKHVLNLINVFDLPFGHKQRFLKNVKRWQDWIVGG